MLNINTNLNNTHKGGKVPSKRDLSTWHKSVTDNVLAEKIEGNPATILPAIAEVDETSQLQFADLSGVTIISYSGTSTLSINGNNIEFTTGVCADLLLSDGTFIPDIYSGYDTNANNDATVVNITKGYSTDGSLHKNKIGYSLYKNGDDEWQVPFLLTGIPKTNPTVPSGFTHSYDFVTGGSNWNMADAMIDFGEYLKYHIYFDSSLATVYEFIIAGEIGDHVNIFWGDGTFEKITYTGADQTINHTYIADTGKYNIYFDNVNFSKIEINNQKIEGNCEEFDASYYLRLYNFSLLTGSVSKFNPSYSIELYAITLLTGNINNLNPSYSIIIRYCPLLTGNISNLNPSHDIRLQYITLLTGNISNLNPSYSIDLEKIPLITIDFPMIFQYSLKYITIKNCSLTQIEVDRIVDRAYENGNTGGTMNITGNATPSAAAIAKINEMVNDRSWTITYTA